MLTSLEWEDYAYEVRFEFLAINNVAEFEAFLAGLRLVEALNAYPLQIYSDSHLVIGQYQGLYKAKNPTMLKYLQKVQRYLSKKDKGKES